MKTHWLLAGLVAAGFASIVALSDEERAAGTKPGAGAGTKAEKATPAQEDAIREAIGRFTKAFNSGDAHAIAQLHTPDARVIDPLGEVLNGREEIEREYHGLFHDNPGLAIEIHPESIQFCGPDAAIEEGTTRVSSKDGATPFVSHYSAVDIKHDGQWLLASVREFPGEATAQERLRDVEWLLGDWVDESSDSVIRSTCRWTSDKQALLREFTVRSLGRVVMTGTQRIGWDPATGQIKSWEFDSEGGHGEGLWARLGNQWVVKATAVLQDGRTSTATHLITPVDSSTCHWRTTDRTVGSQLVPITDEFVMVRPAPGPKAK